MLRLLGFFSIWSPLFVLSAWAMQPCKNKVEGYIKDRITGLPMAFATVKLEDTSIGTFTNDVGYFIIDNICEDEVDLVVSFVGYKTVHHHHDSHHPNPVILLAPDEVLLPSIVVESAHQHGDLSSLTSLSIETALSSLNPTASFGDVASQLSGVGTISTGQNIVKPVIHGLHSNRILIINNGLRHEFQNWGLEHAPEIDPSVSDHITVVKGAATVRYGPEALGGVLLLGQEKLPLHSDLYGKVSTGIASNGRAVENQLKLGKGYEKIAWKIDGGAIRQGDLKAPNYYLTNTAKKENSLSGTLRLHQHNFDLEIFGSHFSQQLGILRGSVTGNLEDLTNAMERDTPQGTQPFSYLLNTPYQSVRHDLITARGSFILGNQTVNMQYGYQKNYRKEFDIRRGTNNEIPAINLELVTHSLDVDVDYPEMAGIHGLIGLQLQLQENDNIPGTNTIPFVPNFYNYRAGLFLIGAKETPWATWESGIRYDLQHMSIAGRSSSNQIFKNELFFQNITATFGFKKDIAPEMEWQMNLSTAWRPPNVAELYSFGKHQAVIQYGLWRYQLNENGIEANEVLNQQKKQVKTENGLKWLNTFSYKKRHIQWEFTQFTNYLQNYIYSRPAGITNTVRGAFPYYIFDQDNALLLGADLSFYWQPNTSLELDGSANYVWAREIKTRSSFVGIPPLSLRQNTTWNLPFDKLKAPKIELGLQYEFRQFDAPPVITASEIYEARLNSIELFTENTGNFDFLAPPKGYLLMDISASTGWKNWVVRVRAANLLNTKYRLYTDQLRYFADQPGRNFMLGLNYIW